MANGKLEVLQRTASAPPVRVAPPYQGFAVQRFRFDPTEIDPHQIADYSLVLHLSPPTTLEWFQSGNSRQQRMHSDGVSLHSPGELPGFRLREPSELLEISLSPLFVRQALHDAAAVVRRLPEVYGVADPLARQIGVALQAEMETDFPGGNLLGESLATALAAHLFARYDTAPTPLHHSPGLPRPDLRRVQEYIHAHLADDLTLNALAALTPYSPHHFSLLFKQAAGLAPHQYVIRERVERARRLLTEGSAPLSEIAYRVGFASQSHLNLHFKRLLNLTPRQYRASLNAK